MKAISRLFRLIYINFILARYGLDNIILSLHLFAPLRFLRYFNPYYWVGQRYSRGVAIRLALQELGPIFVKFGQAISTRRDLIPDDIADELALLLDQVPPFPGLQAQAIVESTFGCKANELFAEFSVEPLASASIAQVHSATLKNGKTVVVKVRRPGIRKQIERDIDLLYAIAKIAERYSRDAKRFRVIEAIAEFERTLLDELDLQREAANATHLRKNFKASPLLYVPEVHWEYVRDNILVMERINGIPVTDIAALKQHNVNIKKLAELGVEIFFTQVFRDSFFHADMHPGNIFVSYLHPEDPQYIGVDFGIMGTLSEKDKRYLAENFHAFFNRDYNRVAVLHIESGWVPYDTRVDEFESAIRTVCEPTFEKPLSQISIASMLLRLFQTGRRFEMHIQPQLMLLQKTLFAVEGLGRQLYPQLDLWRTAKPFMEKWMREQYGPRAAIRELKRATPYWISQLPQLPGLLHDVLRLQKQSFLLDHNQQRQQLLDLSTKPHRNIFWHALGWGLIFAGVAIWLLPQLSLQKTYSINQICLGLIALGGVGLLFSKLSHRSASSWD